MIPKEAFWALTALACVSAAFGFVARGLFDQVHKDCTQQEADPYEDDSWDDDIS